MWWAGWDPLLLVAMAGATVLAGTHAIVNARTPQGAIGWILILILIPIAALPVYLVLGPASRRKMRASRRAVERGRIAGTDPGPEDEPVGDSRLRVFERLSGQNATRGNNVELLIDGEKTYEALFAAIEKAEKYLLIQFYIVRDDEIGRRLKSAVLERAQAGVRVFMLNDAFHGVGLPWAWVRELKKYGVEVRAPQGPRGPLGRFQFNYRNHRKMLIADGKVAFTGGLNIGLEYLGLDPAYGPWRDTHIRVTGPMIARFQDDFRIDWRWSTGADPDVELEWDIPPDPRDMCGLVMAPAPTSRIENGNMYFTALIQAADVRLWIATPYFVPDSDVLAALKLAALRGVDVRLLVPNRPDHYLPWLAAFTYFDEIREAGVEVWRYTAAFLHQKVVLVDDCLVSIGTVNLDIRSCMLNFETTAIVADRAFAAEVEKMLEADLARSMRMERTLDQQPFWLRAAAPVARLMAPLL
jgi:cardiolipin synthase